MIISLNPFHSLNWWRVFRRWCVAALRMAQTSLSFIFRICISTYWRAGYFAVDVELGQVRSSRLAKAGDLSSAVGFNIKLNDCDTNVSSNAAVAFLGTTVTSNDDTLALQSSAAGSAQNVGIQILDRTGEVLVLDGATFSAKTDLIDGTNILPFQARYIALGQSVAGTANADATFKVQYL
ncbi:fimbrial protein [Escherichia coli]|nr:fimbrial protein [Escherichia coli]